VIPVLRALMAAIGWREKGGKGKDGRQQVNDKKERIKEGRSPNLVHSNQPFSEIPQDGDNYWFDAKA